MKILIIGAESAGLACATRLRRAAEAAMIIIIDERAEIPQAADLREVYNIETRPHTTLVNAYQGFVLLNDGLTERVYQEACDILVDSRGTTQNGRDKADEILGQIRAYPAPPGLRRLGVDSAEIGLNEEQLTEMAAEYIYAVLPIDSGFLKLIFNAAGQIYGFMAKGRGIARFTDTMSAFMAHGGNIHGLTQLETLDNTQELPTLGRIAQNVVEGRINLAYPDEIDGLDPEKTTLLDISRREIFAENHLPNSINIPLRELRDSLYRLDAHKEIITICERGRGAYIAARILAGRGFRARLLTGGMRYFSLTLHSRESGNPPKLAGDYAPSAE
ncbi:MAG: hypothetical protein LBE35_02480 [Clostridiales bacterium]|jgi:rhodanese-related sulfurtransferase|nr:hypothetical protein [Clostridiales bacterium]